ncbi:hypothetical protein OUZ56_033026 [Daphnia magna]|uniref:Uncharacterized protein n=1 Tax=Daphnia magna TaxID=35525 RepID=A0ABR0BA20_9CRUS|nr:hypothetical protein OUZ56_033026 [Daphnia magna]
MAQNPAESAASIKKKLKESREKEEECVRNLKENQLQLVQARKEAVDVIYAHQRVVLRLNEEIAQGAEDLVHYRTEREKMLSGFVGELLRKIREKEVAENVHVAVPIPDAPKFVVPRHTPTIRCFLPEHLEKPGSYRCTLKMAECEDIDASGVFCPSPLRVTTPCPIARILGAVTYADLETITRSSVALGALTRGSCRKTTERRQVEVLTDDEILSIETEQREETVLIIDTENQGGADENPCVSKETVVSSTISIPEILADGGGLDVLERYQIPNHRRVSLT